MVVYNDFPASSHASLPVMPSVASTFPPTGFRYVAHVPPKAVGPQFGQGIELTGLQKLGGVLLGLAIGIPLAVWAVRR